MKRIFALILTAAVLLSACSFHVADTDGRITEYVALTSINHYVVEPDERAVMTDEDERLFRGMVDAMLARAPSAALPDDKEHAALLIDCLRQTPYFFFVDSYTVEDGAIHLSYAYDSDRMEEMLAFMDEQLLLIANHEASDTDNALDTVLKVYHAVTHMTYDKERTTDKEVTSPLFVYPADEIYKALRDNRSVCYGFAYIMRYVLLQYDIDIFCVYGEVTSKNEGHMWNIVRLSDSYYHIDAGWDRDRGLYSRLMMFGKTDAERRADGIAFGDFADDHYAAYGAVVCDDTRFSFFRNVSRFSPAGEHSFYLEAGDNGYLYHTDTGELAEG